MQYIEKPKTIHAEQFFDNVESIVRLSNFIDNQDLVINYKNPKDPVVKLITFSEIKEVHTGDYIIKANDGTFYSMSKEQFENK